MAWESGVKWTSMEKVFFHGFIALCLYQTGGIYGQKRQRFRSLHIQSIKSQWDFKIDLIKKGFLPYLLSQQQVRTRAIVGPVLTCNNNNNNVSTFNYLTNL